MSLLPFGKLDHQRLAALLGRFARCNDPSVLISARVGVDAAALQVGDAILVCTTDPITFATDRIGGYAVEVNANDVAVMGGRPQWMQACLLLPPSEEATIETIFQDLYETAARQNISVIGGHTEITPGLDRPIVIVTMLGLAERLVTAADARAGDDLLLTKGIALEGAAVIAREIMAQRLNPAVVGAAAAQQPTAVNAVPPVESGLSRSVLQRAADYLDHPGISVVPEARLAVQQGAHALHDPTEGGLLTGIWEMAEASGLGVEVELSQIPLLPDAQRLCAACGLDIYRTLASGALLIACSAPTTPHLVAALEHEKIAVTKIGRFLEGPRQCVQGAGRMPLNPSAQDELTKLFGTWRSEK